MPGELLEFEGLLANQRQQLFIETARDAVVPLFLRPDGGRRFAAEQFIGDAQQVVNQPLFQTAHLLQTLRLGAKPTQRRLPLIRRGLSGTGDPPQLLNFQTGLALGHKQRGLRHLRQRLETVKTGLLTIDSVHQQLTKLIAKLTAGKAGCPQRALLPHQLFPLHKAVERHHAPGNLRVVNAVVELRDNI